MVEDALDMIISCADPYSIFYGTMSKVDMPEMLSLFGHLYASCLRAFKIAVKLGQSARRWSIRLLAFQKTLNRPNVPNPTEAERNSMDNILGNALTSALVSRGSASRTISSAIRRVPLMHPYYSFSTHFRG